MQSGTRVFPVNNFDRRNHLVAPDFLSSPGRFYWKYSNKRVLSILAFKFI